jgi:hypothetical protein
MDYSTAKKGFWKLKCPCGASFRVGGENLEAKDISCPNCQASVPMDDVRKAYTGYLQFLAAQFRLGKAGKEGWSVFPPA